MKRFVVNCVYISLICLICSCGKKTLPLPLPEERMEIPRVSIEKADVSSEGITLSWTYSEKLKDRENYPFCFVVEKAEIPWEGPGCIDCPNLPWEKSKCISPDYPDPAIRRGNRLIWKDDNVLPHHAYRYRLVVYDVEKRRPLYYGKPIDVKTYEFPPLIKKASLKASKEGILVKWFLSGKEAKSIINSRGLSFAVERRTEGKLWHRIDTGNYQESAFLDGEVKPGEVYEYRVTPYYRVGRVTVWGKPRLIGRVRAVDRILPPPPKTVWVVPSSKGLEVHWLEVTVPVSGYYVYRKDPDGTIIRLNQNPVSHPPFIDTQVKKNRVYSYAVSSASPTPPYKEGLVSSWIEIRNVFYK